MVVMIKSKKGGKRFPLEHQLNYKLRLKTVPPPPPQYLVCLFYDFMLFFFFFQKFGIPYNLQGTSFNLDIDPKSSK